MDFLNLAKERFSARAFSAQVVEEDKVNYLLACAQRAPSACNKQPWHFVVAQTEDARQKVQQCYNRDWLKTAPLYIIIYAADDRAWVREEDGKNHADIDAAIAIEHLCLAATAVGLGSCWVCNFDVAALQAAFPLGKSVASRGHSAHRLSCKHAFKAITSQGNRRNRVAFLVPERMQNTTLKVRKSAVKNHTKASRRAFLQI